MGSSQGYIDLSYDALGTKLWKTHTVVGSNGLVGTTYSYYDDFVYLGSTLDQVRFDGGHITFSSTGTPQYHYYHQDHLGSVRVVTDASGNVEQRRSYYPFGASFREDATTDGNRIKFCGKELDRMHALNDYDFGARTYLPVLGRFTQMDPLCEKYYNISPYAYCANNPVNYVDPDGKKIYIPHNFQSEVLKMINTYSRTQYKVNEKGYMCVDHNAGINEKGSNHYSEKIDATIAAKGKLTLMVSDKYTLPNGETRDVEKDYGGGLTITDKTKKADVKTIITGRGHLVHDTNGNETEKSAAEILIHEIVGHAAPALAGSETGNAIGNENIVRKELGLPERIVNNKHYE